MAPIGPPQPEARSRRLAGELSTAPTPGERHQLRLVIFQAAPGEWLARGLEHDVVAEASSIGESVRAILRLLDAHTAFDLRHQHVPLSAFRPAPQKCWNFYTTGSTVSLAQLGIVAPPNWDIRVAVTTRNPL